MKEILAPETRCLVLVGNKIDDEEERIITKGRVATYFDPQEIPFFEVSAKTGDGIEELFHEIVRALPKESKDKVLGKKETKQNKCSIY